MSEEDTGAIQIRSATRNQAANGFAGVHVQIHPYRCNSRQPDGIIATPRLIVTSDDMTELYIAFQRLLPQALLGRLVYALARVRTPWLKDMLIKGFVRLYDVDTSEAENPVPSGYSNFNDFFTRSLKPGARPLDADPAVISCPADGTVQRAGTIRNGTLIQAKGISYTAADLLGDPDAAQAYDGGHYLTVYLAPYNYHRVHAPLTGQLQAMHYAPGARMAVNQTTAAAVPNLFAGNERLACHFSTATGPYAIVLVGALNVASISTAWAGEVLPASPPRFRDWRYRGQAAVQLARGDYLGHFNLGSTIVLLLPPGIGELDSDLNAGRPVQVGERIGRLMP